MHPFRSNLDAYMYIFYPVNTGTTIIIIIACIIIVAVISELAYLQIVDTHVDEFR